MVLYCWLRMCEYDCGMEVGGQVGVDRVGTRQAQIEAVLWVKGERVGKGGEGVTWWVESAV